MYLLLLLRFRNVPLLQPGAQTRAPEAERQGHDRRMQHQDNSGLPRNSMRPADHPLWYDSCLGAVLKGLFSSFFLRYLFPLQGVMTLALSLALCHPGTGRDRHRAVHTILYFQPPFWGSPCCKGCNRSCTACSPHRFARPLPAVPLPAPAIPLLPPPVPLNLEKFPPCAAPSLYRSLAEDHEPPCVPSLGRRTRPG